MAGPAQGAGLAEAKAALQRPPFSLLLTICEAADTTEADDLVGDALRLCASQEQALLRAVASAEIRRTRDSPQLFRGTSVASKLLSRWARSNRESMSWLRSVLEKPVASILDNRVILLELDGKEGKAPRKGLLSRTVSSGQVSDSLPAEEPATGSMHISSEAKRSLAKLESLGKCFMESIFSSASRVPRSFRELCHHMQQETLRRFGDGVKLSRGEFTCCSSFVFLRFVCPAILSPQSFGLSKSSPPPDVMRTLVLVSKLLTSAANGTTLSEAQLATLNALLLREQDRMTEFLTTLCTLPPASEPKEVSGSHIAKRTLFASGPIRREDQKEKEKEKEKEKDKEKDKDKTVPAVPELKNVASVNREERALLQILSWAAKHAFTVQTSIREREELDEEERAALSTEWETFLALLMRLPPEMLVPQPRSSRTTRSARGEKKKEGDETAYQPKEGRKSRILETIGDWLDGNESKRKARAKSEANSRPATQDLLLALETPEVSAWLVDMEKKGGDHRQAVLYIYALLEELYRLRTGEVSANSSARSAHTQKGPSPRSSQPASALSSPANASSRKSSMKRRVHVSVQDLAPQPRDKERRERREKEEREREREDKERDREKEKEKKEKKEKEKEKRNKKDRERGSEKERDRVRDKDREKDEKEKEKEKHGNSHRPQSPVTRSVSNSPAYVSRVSSNERRRSVQLSSSVNGSPH